MTELLTIEQTQTLASDEIEVLLCDGAKELSRTLVHDFSDIRFTVRRMGRMTVIRYADGGLLGYIKHPYGRWVARGDTVVVHVDMTVEMVTT